MRLLARPVLMTSIVALSLAAFPGSAAATFVPGPNGKISFASGRASVGIPAPAANDADARIWVADYPSGAPVQVTTLPAGVQHRHPSWSPDHTRIAYAAGVAFSGTYAIWIVDLRTGGQTEFVAAAAGQDRPSWSPDGTRIAYGSGGDIYVKAVAPGSAPVKVTDDVAAEERPVWSPDGGTIYYNRGAAGNRDLYRKTPVALAGTETAVIAEVGTDDWQPAVSPDGTRLCFLRGPQSDGADLFTVNVNGTGVTPFSTAATGDLNCVWSPDGTRVLFTLGAFTAGQLVTRNANGGDPQPLASMNVALHFDGNADWATDFSPTCDDRGVSVAVNGFVTIELSCVDPDSGAGAAPPTAAALDDGAIEIVSPPANGNIGALQANRRIIYTPGKDFRGTDSFTYRGSDGRSDSAPATVTVTVGATGVTGGGGPGPTAPSADVTAPVISDLTLSPRRWRLGPGLPAIARTAVGTTISFRLSEAAQATLGFERARAGRRLGRACVAPTRANRARRPCTRFVPAGGIAGFAAKAGLNRVRFSGRISRSRRLALGRHRVLLTAQDAAGLRSARRTGPSFTIVAR